MNRSGPTGYGAWKVKIETLPEDKGAQGYYFVVAELADGQFFCMTQNNAGVASYQPCAGDKGFYGMAATHLATVNLDMATGVSDLRTLPLKSLYAGYGRGVTVDEALADALDVNSSGGKYDKIYP